MPETWGSMGKTFSAHLNIKECQVHMQQVSITYSQGQGMVREAWAPPRLVL